MRKDNRWGYTRILGEFRTLNISAVSWITVKNVIRENGNAPGAQRGLGTWDEFIKIHAATLWQCDFVSKRIVTPKGIRDAFLLVFLHVETRRVFISPATQHPNEAWVNEQAAAFPKHANKAKLGADVIMHDRDAKFARSFDAALEEADLQVQWTPLPSSLFAIQAEINVKQSLSQNQPRRFHLNCEPRQYGRRERDATAREKHPAPDFVSCSSFLCFAPFADPPWPPLNGRVVVRHTLTFE